MSIYQAVGIGSRVVLQSLIRRTPAGTKKEYREASELFHAQLAKEARSVRTRLVQERSEAVLRAAQVTKGALNQFLSTPIRSDNEEVQRILRDGFEKLGGQVGPDDGAEFFASWDAKVLTDPAKGAGVGRLVSAARRELVGCGVKTTGTGDLVETCYTAAGLCTPEVADRIVRSTLNALDDNVRSVLAFDVSNVATGWHNVFSSGPVKGGPRLWEAAMKPDLHSAMTWEEFVPVAEGMSKEFNLDAVQIWKECSAAPLKENLLLRIRLMADPQLLGALVRWIQGWHEKPVGTALTKSGSLLVKEILS